MKRATIQWLVWPITSFVVLFFYFWGLSYLGELNHKENPVREDSNIFPLTKNWKFSKGDSIKWASPSFNDSAWQIVQTDSLPESYAGEIAWFRLNYKADSNLFCEPIAFIMDHFGASEIFIDGNKIAGFGKVSDDILKEELFQPKTLPFSVNLNCETNHLIAVRFSLAHYTEFSEAGSDFNSGFTLSSTSGEQWQKINIGLRAGLFGNYSLGIFLVTLALIHLLLFLFYRKAKENFYFALFAISYAGIFFFASAANYSTNPYVIFFSDKAIMLLGNPILFLTLLLFVNRVYENGFPKSTWLAVIAAVLSSLYVLFGWFNNGVYSMCGVWLAIFTVITMIIGTYKAVKEKRPGAKILGFSIVVFALFIFFALSLLFYSGGNGFQISLKNPVYLIIMLALLMSIPISMSVYLAYNFSITNRNLQQKLTEVETLSAKSIEQEKEKQKILESQKETLEIQVEERTSEINEQKKLIEEKNKDITDSINYAKRIQEAILPAKELKYKLFPDAFVLFKPKDIVSGDFYWFAEKSGKRLIASADCTGHGVPGALMSMIGNNFLNELVNEKGITSPDEILNLLHKEIRKALKQGENSDAKDGMDIALITFNSETEIEYAGAQRPLWMIKNNLLEEIKADKFSIGGLQSETERKFTKHRITLTKNDCVYIFSDGFADQFGGAEGKKFMSKQFKNLLLSAYQKSMNEQEKILNDTIDKWKGNTQQIDDILVIGIRV